MKSTYCMRMSRKASYPKVMGSFHLELWFTVAAVPQTFPVNSKSVSSVSILISKCAICDLT